MEKLKIELSKRPSTLEVFHEKDNVLLIVMAGEDFTVGNTFSEIIRVVSTLSEYEKARVIKNTENLLILLMVKS